MPVPNNSKHKIPIAAVKELPQPSEAAKNSVKMVIIAGNRPLQGMQTLVSMAISRSRGESIIRQPVTPAALQPSPIHIVRDCFPHVPAQRKQGSN